MKKSSFVFASLLLLTACNPVKRKIASTGLPPEVMNLKEASEQILADVEDEEFKTHCVPYLRKLEKNIDGIDVRKLAKDEVSRDAEEIAKTSWKIRTTLHSKLVAVDKDCAIQMQATFRQ
jgi:hypothetical protein